MFLRYNLNGSVDIICYVLALLFIYTGVSKIGESEIMKEQLLNVLFLQPFAGAISVVIPWIELLAAVFLLVPRLRRVGLYLSLVLMVSFTIYVSSILFFDRNLPCTCGGVINSLSWEGHVVMNVFLSLISCVGIYLYRRTTQDGNDI